MTAKPHSKPRGWRRWLAVALLAIGLAVGLLPVWFPWVVRPVAGRLGLRYQAYERVSYDRFRLRELTYRSARLEIQIRAVESRLFWGWLIHRWLWPGTSPPVCLAAEGCSVRFLAPDEATPRPQTGPGSTSAVLDKIAVWVPRVGNWLPTARLRDGLVAWPEVSLALPEATWHRGRLHLQLVHANTTTAIELHLDTRSLPAWRVVGRIPELDLNVAADGRRSGSGWELEGQVLWATNAIRFQTGLGGTGWWPETAGVQAERIRLPRDLLRGVGLEEVTGAVRADWTNGHYSFLVQISAEGRVDSPFLPGRADVALGGRGDMDRVSLERVAIRAPPLRADLAAPATIGLTNRWEVPEARLQVTYDLPEVGPFRLGGRLRGELRTRPGPAALPNVDFALAGDPGEVRGVAVTGLSLRGKLSWPVLSWDHAEAVVDGEGRVELRGAADLGKRVLTGLTGRYGGRVPPAWLPGGLHLEGIEATVHAQGRWPEVSHSAHITATNLRSGVLRLDRAALSWTGQAGQIDHWQAEGQAGPSSLTSAGSLMFDYEEDWISGQVVRLDLLRDRAALLQLRHPAGFRFPTLLHSTNAMSGIRLEKLMLGSGSADTVGRELTLQADLRWPRHGSFGLEMANFDARAVQDFLTTPLPPVRVRELRLEADWQGGPVRSEIGVVADYQLPGAEPLVWSGTAELDAAGLRVPLLTVAQAHFTMAKLEANLPLICHPATPEQRWGFDETKPLQIRMETIQSDPLWELLETQAPVRTVNPNLTLTVTGPLRQAAAALEFTAGKIVLTNTNLPISQAGLENVRVRIAADRQQIQVSEGTFSVLGQPGMLSGQYKIHAENWAEWVNRLRKPDWGQLSARVGLRDAALEAAAPLFPEILLPLGALNLEAELRPGLEVRAHLLITNAATRPLGSVGSLRDVQARINLVWPTATLEMFQASLAGQPVTATGWLRYQTDAPPLYQLQLRGDNLSLVRSADLFLRGDLDLLLQNPSNHPPRIAGQINLHDSLLFQDFRSLLKINLNEPKQRPPYFSITTRPVADWQMDLHVKGDRFLRAISPAFRGEISTALHLSGSLREPVAIGDVVVASGRVLFPFGTLEVTRGRAYLTQEDPYRPRLDVQASGQSFGYTIRINVSGTAEAPNLMFHAVPPLTPKEVLLMLSAGEVPHQAVAFGTADKASRVGFYLGKELVGQFLGAEDAAERLIIRSGEQVTQGGRLTYSLEYKLSDRWSAIGEYTRFQDFNSGLKFRLYSK